MGSISVTAPARPGPERFRTALAHVAVAADQRRLATDQHVGAAVDAVDQRVAGAVLVVELGLGDRVVDVDRRERQLTCRRELVQPQHTGGGLLGDALDRLGDLGPLGLVGLEALGSAGTPCTRRSRRPRRRHHAGLLELGAPHTIIVASPPSSRIMLAGSPSQVSICSAAHQYSSRVSPFHAKTAALGLLRRAVRTDDDGRGGVVLGGEDVARRPAHLGTESDERLDQHRGLHGHVQRAGDARALERQHVGVLAPQRHQPGHLVSATGSPCGRVGSPRSATLNRCRCGHPRSAGSRSSSWATR